MLSVMLRYRPTFQPFPGGIRMTSQLISNCEFVNGPWPCLRMCEELYVKGVNDVQVKVVVQGPCYCRIKLTSLEALVLH